MATVDQIMQRTVVSLAPTMSLREAAGILADHQIGGAPVCDDAGRVVGMLSKSDLTDFFDDPRAHEVGEVMMPSVFFVRPYESVERAIHLMAFEGVHRLVVLGAHGGLEGIVSSMDVLRHLAGLVEAPRVEAVAPPEAPPA